MRAGEERKRDSGPVGFKHYIVTVCLTGISTAELGTDGESLTSPLGY